MDARVGEPGDGPLAAYRRRVAAGELVEDQGQARAVAALERLHRELEGRDPAPPRGLLGRLARRPPPEPPRGLYLHGGVGRGKSMLMDLFFARAPVTAKRRVHFHAFMLEVHGRLHERRQSHPGEPDPVGPLAAAIAEEARLLCFDELVVGDIADAMILGRLLDGLLSAGVVLVATSNLEPDRLYEDGLQRHLFLPCIEMLKRRLEVVALAGDTDHRLARLRQLRTYHTPLGPQAERALEQAFAALSDGAPDGPETLAVGSRTLGVPRAADGVAFFAFEDLCERALGAADYLALTERYHTLVLAGVPALAPDRRNEARRFMTLVDALYERRRNLVVSAAAPPDELYATGDGAFEFRRTASRLHEMQSEAYVVAARRRVQAAPAKLEAFALTSDLT
jgi:cell division protein ZapE